MERTWRSSKISKRQAAAYIKFIESNSLDFKFILNKAKELNRRSVFEYRFEEEFKENIHLYEKTLINYGTRN